VRSALRGTAATRRHPATGRGARSPASQPPPQVPGDLRPHVPAHREPGRSGRFLLTRQRSWGARSKLPAPGPREPSTATRAQLTRAPGSADHEPSTATRRPRAEVPAPSSQLRGRASRRRYGPRPHVAAHKARNHAPRYHGDTGSRYGQPPRANHPDARPARRGYGAVGQPAEAKRPAASQPASTRPSSPRAHAHTHRRDGQRPPGARGGQCPASRRTRQTAAGIDVFGQRRPGPTQSHLLGAGPLTPDTLLLFNAYLGTGAARGGRVHAFGFPTH
jgi:hypothetical protein